MARKTLNSINLLKSWISLQFPEIPLFYVNFRNFHKLLRNREIPSSRTTGHRKPAQTMNTLRNYIGFGEANQLWDHQNQPGSSRITIFALWVTFE